MDLPLLFLLKKIVSQLLLPPLLPLLCIVAGLLLMRRRPCFGKWLAWGGVVMSLFFTTPASVNLITLPLEDVPLLQEADLESAQAIVILGAGYRRHAPEYGVAIPNRLALERLRFGARLAHYSDLPVLVSGEAQLLADSLKYDFGVAPRWLEGDSLDTRDNARLSTAILKEAGIQRVVLVTHAAHMKRAMGEFALNGMDVIPAPTGFLSEFDDDGEDVLFDYFPGATAAYSGWYAIHEWIGLLAFKLRGLFPIGGSV